MSNPARDYFSTLPTGVLKKLADPHAIKLASVRKATSGHSVSIDGDVYRVGSTVPIILQSAALQPQNGRTWFVVYGYSLSPNVNADCTVFVPDTTVANGERAIPGAQFPPHLFSREKPWELTFRTHDQWAVGYQEIPLSAVDSGAVHMKWDLAVPAFAGTLSGSEFRLQNFRLYSVKAFRMTLEISGPGLIPVISLPLATAPTGSVELPAWNNSTISSAFDTALIVTGVGAKVRFEGTVPTDPTLPLSTSAVVIPAKIGGVEPPAGSAVVYLIGYLALLDAYKKNLSKVLSLKEAVELDAERLGIPPNPVPSPIIARDHRFMANINAVSRPGSAPLLGGAAGMDLARHLKLAQVLGQSATHLETTKSDFTDIVAQLLPFGLSAIHASYYWIKNFLILGRDTNLSTESFAVGKNPLQLDAIASLQAAKAFLTDHPGLDALAAPGGRFIVQSPELGDTWSATTFQLTGTDAIGARAKITTSRLQLISPLQSLTWHLNQFGLQADQQYQAGFRLDLIARFDELLKRFQAAVKMAPASVAVDSFVADCRNSLQVFLIVAKGAGDSLAGPGGEWHFDVSESPGDDPPLHATNGVYDQFISGTADGYAAKSLSARRPAPIALEQQRVLWYHAIRYWNQANIAYLSLTVNPLARPLGRVPFSHTSNMNTPRGYWSGFEHYHLARSGVMDIFWFEDLSTRWKVPTNSGPSVSHIAFQTNAIADFAQACVRVRDSEASYRAIPREIGVYLASDRVDLKSMVWASRGATHFQVYAAATQYLVPDGLWDTGDQSKMFMAQSVCITKLLLKAQSLLRGSRRPPAVVGILVPMSDGAWDADGDPTVLAGQVLNLSTKGLHALFTQRHLAVDFIFEEQIVDEPNLLNQYQVVASTLKLMRDDVFLSLARWVETSRGVFVCAAGHHFCDETATPFADITVGSCFNEYYEFRQNRLDWLLGTNAASIKPPAVHQVTAHGLGFVVVPNELPNGGLNVNFPYEARIGWRYIYGLPSVRGFFIESSTTFGDSVCENLFTRVDKCVERARGLGRTLLTQRHCWVENMGGTPVGGTPEPLVEAVFLQTPGFGPRPAVIVLIDYRQRPFDVTGDERETPIGEAQRTKAHLQVKVNPGLMTVMAAVDMGSGLALTRFGNGFEIWLQDYAIIKLN